MANVGYQKYAVSYERF